MANDNIPDHQHGTEAGVLAHRRAGTRLCQPCVDARSDSRKAWGIATAHNKYLMVPATALRDVFGGVDPEKAFAGVLGPMTLHVLRTGEVPRG